MHMQGTAYIHYYYNYLMIIPYMLRYKVLGIIFQGSQIHI